MALRAVKKPVDFKDVKAGEYAWRISAELAGDEEWLAAPERLIDGNAELLKQPVAGSGTRVMRVRMPTGNLVFKEYGGAGISEMGRSVVRGPRAMWALNVFRQLQRLGVPAVEAIAAGYERRRRWRSILVTKEVPNAQALVPFARGAPQARRGLIRAVAKIMGQMHAAGLYHRDAHQANFLVCERGEPRVLLVDVDGVRRRSRITMNAAARSVSRLRDYTQATRREMLFFAVVYCSQRRGQIGFREFVAEMGKRLEGQ
jgi:hypothetical protein